jgi:hypothetical protein
MDEADEAEILRLLAVDKAVETLLIEYDNGGLKSRHDGRLICAIELLRRAKHGRADEEWAS